MVDITCLYGLIPIWIGMRCGCQEIVAVFQIDPDPSSCWHVAGGIAYPDATNRTVIAAVSRGP